MVVSVHTDERLKQAQIENQLQKIAGKTGQNREELVEKFSTVWETPIHEQRFQNTGSRRNTITKTGQSNTNIEERWERRHGLPG